MTKKYLYNKHSIQIVPARCQLSYQQVRFPLSEGEGSRWVCTLCSLALVALSVVEVPAIIIDRGMTPAELLISGSPFRDAK
jgi:hypothetical protein